MGMELEGAKMSRVEGWNIVTYGGNEKYRVLQIGGEGKDIESRRRLGLCKFSWFENI